MLVSEPTGKFIIGSTLQIGTGGGPIDNNVYAFSISSSAVPGSLTSVNASGFPTSESAAWMAVTPNGKYLYTFNENDQNANQPLFESIQGFSLAGLPSQLTPLPGSPFTVFDANFGRIDQSGNYMIVNGQESTAPVAGTLAIQIQSDGSLTSGFPSTGSAGLFGITDEP
jgi:6-phosphogluconolactonase (cycloisomerase 2 family)